MEQDLNDLGPPLRRQHGSHSPMPLLQGGPSGDSPTFSSDAATTSGLWQYENGSPSDVLELTRAQILNELLRLRDDERQRIGQELHDSAGQLLVSLQLSVACLRGAEQNGAHENLIDEIHETARLIGQEIRSLAFLNHPMRLNPSGLTSALKALIDGFGKRTGCHTRFKSTDHQLLQSEASSMALLRVAQEALVNIHRHAHATCVTASLQPRGAFLEFTICDDGVGMPSADALAIETGVGLQGMRFRVEQLGGEFQIKKLKRGTKILARVPLAA